MDIETKEALDKMLNKYITDIIYYYIIGDGKTTVNLNNIKNNTYYKDILIDTIDDKESNKYHNNVIFDNCIFDYCTLKSRNFINCCFDNCYIKNINMHSIKIDKCIFYKCRINAAMINSSVIINSTYDECDIYFLNIEQSKCITINLYRCNICDANFVEEYLESKFEDVVFNECKKKYAKWYLDYLYGI